MAWLVPNRSLLTGKPIESGDYYVPVRSAGGFTLGEFVRRVSKFEELGL